MAKVSTTPTTYVYVGSFVMPKPPNHEGLHVLRVDPETGALLPVASYIPGLNVGSFAFDPRRNILYVTDEVASTPEFREQYRSSGGGGGRVYAFSITPETGALTEIGHWPSYGTQPAGIALDASGNFLVVSHFTSRTTTTTIVRDPQSGYRIEPRYDDSTTVLFPIDATGHLGNPCDVYIHETPTANRPSCLHSVTLSTDGSFFVVCDMMRDQLAIFVIDPTSTSLHLKNVHDTVPGSGPRYSAFHPSLPVFYVNYEYKPVIEAFSYREDGSHESVAVVDVLPDDLQRIPGTLLSDLRVHPSGNYVYTLVRGHNMISAFSVHAQTGSLQRIQTLALSGVSPKGCAVSSNGRLLYISVSASNEIRVFTIGDNGILSATGYTATVPRPSAITMVDINPM